MNAYKSRIVVAAVATAAGLSIAFVPTANGGQAGSVPDHRHYIVSATGAEIEVGPYVCGNAKMRTAFYQFHAGVHVGGAAAGFRHEHNPVSIKSGPCPTP